MIDRAPDILQMPRAIALDNEALRILQMAGLGEGAFRYRAIPRVRYLSPYAGEFARINSCGSLDGHPKLVTFYQPELERRCAMRRAACHGRGGDRRRDARVQRPGRRGRRRTQAAPTERQPSSRRATSSAADGAASQVGKAIGQDFEGRTYAEEWLIVDAERPDQPIEDIEFICDPRARCRTCRRRAHRERWEFMLHPGESREQMEQDETVRELLAP